MLSRILKKRFEFAKNALNYAGFCKFANLLCICVLRYPNFACDV